MQVVTCKKRILVFTKLFRVYFIISVNTFNSYIQMKQKTYFEIMITPLLVLKFFIFVFVLFCGFTIVVTFFNNLISVNGAIILIK